MESTPQPTIKYETTTTVPAARKTVAPAKVGAVAARNFDDKKSEMTAIVDGLFKQLQTEFQKVSAFSP